MGHSLKLIGQLLTNDQPCTPQRLSSGLHSLVNLASRYRAQVQQHSDAWARPLWNLVLVQATVRACLFLQQPFARFGPGKAAPHVGPSRLAGSCISSEQAACPS